MNRNAFVDFLRGICITEMILVHSGIYWPTPFRQFILLIIDVAAEGFLIIFGYILGSKTYPIYNCNKYKAIKKIYYRSLQILLLHYLMLITIDLPKIIFNNNVENFNLIKSYFIKSLILYNQPFLLDIMPLFFIMLIIAPLVLEMIKRNHLTILIIISITLFIIGILIPKTIVIFEGFSFPPNLWQIYFIFGIILAKNQYVINYIKQNPRRIIMISGGICGIILILRHGSLINASLFSEISILIGFKIQKFPLNFWAFIYSASFIVSITPVLYKIFNISFKSSKTISTITCLGRNSLMVFFIHVYLDYIVKNLETYFNLTLNEARILWLIDYLSIGIIAMKYEKYITYKNQVYNLMK